MGPTKVIVKEDALHDAQSGKLIVSGLASRKQQEEYAAHHYIALPVVDNAGRAWELDGKPVYCFRGSRYESLDEQPVHLARCPDCGGMGIRVDEMTVESDCIRCVRCGHEFDARLQMMES
jgi:DNA-directed RNA polymerase subunit RPC12/RpoP